MELTDAGRNETLSTITKLIADGYLELVILQYAWGIEFELQHNALRAIDESDS